MGLVGVNTTATREHLAEIKRGICLTKERLRCVAKTLPFHFLHKQIVFQMMYFVTMFVNAVPAPEGISQIFSPREIVTQTKIDFKKDCRAQFGLYVEVSTDAIVTNDTMPGTHECIVLGPSGNWQGSTKCVTYIPERL